MSSKKILLVVLTGIAAGVMLGILFAPDLGWNTRKRIVKKGEACTDALMEKIEDILYNMSEDTDDDSDEIFDLSEEDKITTTES